MMIEFDWNILLNEDNQLILPVAGLGVDINVKEVTGGIEAHL